MKFIGISKTIIALSLSSMLVACTLPNMSPTAQLEQKKLVSNSNTIIKVKNKSISEYHCKNNKTIRIQPDNTKKNTINLTFEQTTHTLSSVLTKKNKKYSNIRWIWSEDFNGKGTLRDNRNKILAENCVKQ